MTLFSSIISFTTIAEIPQEELLFNDLITSVHMGRSRDQANDVLFDHCNVYMTYFEAGNSYDRRQRGRKTRSLYAERDEDVTWIMVRNDVGLITFGPEACLDDFSFKSLKFSKNKLIPWQRYSNTYRTYVTARIERNYWWGDSMDAYSEACHDGFVIGFNINENA